MSLRIKSLTATAIVALAAAAASPALAAGTAAGTSISNTATVAYKVNALSQAAITNSASVVVDRVVNLTVAGDATTTTVTPGASGAVVKYTINNTSNATLDFSLTATQPVGGSAPNGGTDSFDVTGGKFYADTNTNGAYNAGVDTEITFLDEIPADGIRTVFYVANIPVGLANNAASVVAVTATARASGASGTLGATLSQTTSANTAAMDTVFADGAGAIDAARDASFSARDDYTVATSSLKVTRTNTVISDPVNGTTNPKAIPGAVLEFCVQVANEAGSVTATEVGVADTVSADLDYSTAFGIFQGGTIDTVTGACKADGTAATTYNTTSRVVTGALGTLVAGDTKTVRYRATMK